MEKNMMRGFDDFPNKIMKRMNDHMKNFDKNFGLGKMDMKMPDFGDFGMGGMGDFGKMGKMMDNLEK